MTYTDQELADLAAQEISEAIKACAVNTPFSGPQPGHVGKIGLAKRDALDARYEAAVSRYLPVQVFDVADGEFRPAEGDQNA